MNARCHIAVAVALVLVLGVPCARAQKRAGNGTYGMPWVGEAGIREKTADIMSRATGYQRPPELPWKTPKNRPRGRVNFDYLHSTPDSPPPVGGNGGEPVAAAGQSSALSFTGATLSDTQAFPPDSMGAAGPSQFIVAVNGRIRSFNKVTGAADGVLDVNPDVFFSSVMTPPVASNFTSDPRIRYDRLSGRWFLIMIDVPGQAGALPNRIMFAVSAGAIITPATVWTFFQFQHDLPAPQNNADTGKFADYPTLGIDAHALYIGVNIFGTRGQGGFSSTTAFVVRKSSLLGAGPIVVTPFRDLIEGNPNVSGPYTPQGVDNYDPAATEGYFIGVDASFYGRLKLRRVSDPGGSPTLSDNITITVPATGNTINVPHLGNNNGASGYLDALDYRLLAAHIRNGKLWTAANLAVDNTGSPSGTDTRMGIRWYEMTGIATGQTPSVVQAGTLFQPSGANTTDQRSYWMGSIMVSGQGHALLGFTTAGQNEYANAGYAGRLAGDPSNTLRTPALYTASTTSYNPPGDPGGAAGRRWGDFSYTCLDPNDDMTMWTIQEWCHAQDSYAVQVVKVLAPPPAAPAICNPASLNQGANNFNITLTGNTDGDTGFFDPGPGFSNRIAVAIGGTGVTVNSITYHTPTNLTLNLTVSAGATAGSRTVTVTNPDGQSAVSSGGILTINAIVTTNNPPVLPGIAGKTVVEGNLLAFTNTATDPNGDALSYSLGAGAPAGATVTNNGVFTWTPGESQGPGTNQISMIVTDNGTPSLGATQTFTVFVLETNNYSPVLAAVASRTIHAGTTLVITNTATDADLPPNPVTFSLDPGAPTTAGINATNGVFSWTPADAEAGTTNSVTVRATDTGTPPLSDTETFSVTVIGRPVIARLSFSNSVPTLEWSAIAGQSYRLQYATLLANPEWSNVAGDLTATGNTASKTDPAPATTNRFYRVRVLP